MSRDSDSAGTHGADVGTFASMTGTRAAVTGTRAAVTGTRAAVTGTRAAVIGTRAAVAAGHPAGARAAMRMVQAGGSIVDAAIAASAALTVALPQATSLGGDAFILVRDAVSGTVHGLNASGVAPRLATPEQFSAGMSVHGPRAPVVPGLVGAWQALHQRFGRAAWGSLFDEAVMLAGEGCEITPHLARAIAASESVLGRDRGCAELFLPSGHALAAGSLLCQPALAGTLRSIAEGGAAAFYEGEIGARLTRYIEAAGGLMAADDLRRYAVAWTDPLWSRYRGYDVAVMPPNSYGVLMLMQLNALAILPRDKLDGDTATRMQWQMRAMRASFAVGLPQIGDPLSMSMAAADLLGGTTTDRVRALMLAEPGAAQPVPAGGTACVTVADAAGNAACIVQSVYNPFGSHFLDPGTGILLNNRMATFDPLPGRVNSVAPGKRPAHTLNPVMVLHSGRLRWVYASPGGASQTITGTQVLVNLIDRGLDGPHAVSDGRWGVDRKGNILIEATTPPHIEMALKARGLDATRPQDTYAFGSAKLIDCGPDHVLRAAADARRDACALAM